MKIAARNEAGWGIVAVSGRLDATTAADFDQKVGDAIDGGSRQVLRDREGLEYISSAGLRCLLVAAKKLKAAGGRLALCRLSGLVREVIDFSGFSVLLTVYDNVEQAVGVAKGA